MAHFIKRKYKKVSIKLTLSFKKTVEKNYRKPKKKKQIDRNNRKMVWKMKW